MITLARLLPAAADTTRQSPNCDARPSSVSAIRCVVLHATADGGHESEAEAWLCDPQSNVSAHLHVRRDGTVARLVADELRAWHAGRSWWRGSPRVNDFSLGWEIANENDGLEPYTDAQYEALARLSAHYSLQGMPLDAFVSHAEVARPRGRKRDPAGFDWSRWRAQTSEVQGYVY